MKKLYLIRHAKSEWGNPLLADFDRPLNERGKKNAVSIGKVLSEKNIKPDNIYSSSSKRTSSTINRICKEIGYDKDKIAFDRELYDNLSSGVDFYISYLMNIKDKHKSIFFVGHNYTWSELASALTGEDLGDMPTCSVVAIEFDEKKWKDIGYGKGKLDFFITPKTIKD